MKTKKHKDPRYIPSLNPEKRSWYQEALIKSYGSKQKAERAIHLSKIRGNGLYGMMKNDYVI